jgi:hypothetical protein
MSSLRDSTEICSPYHHGHFGAAPSQPRPGGPALRRRAIVARRAIERQWHGPRPPSDFTRCLHKGRRTSHRVASAPPLSRRLSRTGLRRTLRPSAVLHRWSVDQASPMCVCWGVCCVVASASTCAARPRIGAAHHDPKLLERMTAICPSSAFPPTIYRSASMKRRSSIAYVRLLPRMLRSGSSVDLFSASLYRGLS